MPINSPCYPTMKPVSVMNKVSVLVLYLLIFTSNSFAVNNEKPVNYKPSMTSIENKSIKITFYSKTGKFDVLDKTKKVMVFKNAMFRFDDYVSSDPNLNFTCRKEDKALKITGAYKDGVKLFLTIELSDTSTAAVFTPAIENGSKNTITVKDLRAISDASLYPKMKLNNVQLLDGNGGAEITHVRNEPFCNSRNNLLFTATAGNQRVSFTIGGLSYEYFEKFASVNSLITRKVVLKNEMKQQRQRMLTYLNLSEGNPNVKEEGLSLALEQGKPYTLQTTSISELNQVAYHEKEVIVGVEGLSSSKDYTIGFSWIDEFDKRVQSVFVADAANPDKKYPLLLSYKLPTALEQDTAEQWLYNIPAAALRSGRIKLFFQKVNKVPNAVLSEVWINEGRINAGGVVTHVRSGEARKLVANLYALDPVGKRLNPGESFTAENDKFYVDIITEDPFESLEKYAFALKEQQKINIRHYTFPTVCLWYASHDGYGGEAAAVNDSKGAVDEMTRIAKSGFLKYSTASVRLVPDSYLPNNEQGWWDDAHWQKYGSGGGTEHVEYNVKVEGGHYKPPYETTVKWANAVTKQGGIPLFYFQTGVRSQDYAETFPEHMLFNEANYEARNYWPNPNKGTYDFTDPGFIKHMRNVYSNLRKSGIQGLMFDYPITGWADYGGFEDKTKTTAWAYRNIFKLAHEGLNGDSSLVHERNLERGSEITLGTVASQRVWGDTDGMTPEMMTRCGLRWYKNRVVLSYDTDSKNLAKFRKISRDKLQQVLTIVYVTTGRLLVGNSFGLLSKEDIYDLSRVFPFHETLQSARPVDAFVNFYPSVYDFKVNEKWHQVTLYNTDEGKEKDFKVNLSASNVEGGLKLNPSKEYYAYDFWNRNLIGKLSGRAELNQTLRKDEARMISIHEVQKHPQFISTNRHIMQGYLDLEDVKWDESASELSGTAKVNGSEPFKIIVAGNGFKPEKTISNSKGVKVNVLPSGFPEIYELEINSSVNQSVDWRISFSKNT